MGTFAGGLSRTGLITVVITLIGVFDGILDNIMFYKMHDLINNKKRLYSWIKFPKIKCALLVHILLSVWNDKHLRNVYFISGLLCSSKICILLMNQEFSESLTFCETNKYPFYNLYLFYNWVRSLKLFK